MGFRLSTVGLPHLSKGAQSQFSQSGPITVTDFQKLSTLVSRRDAPFERRTWAFFSVRNGVAPSRAPLNSEQSTCLRHEAMDITKVTQTTGSGSWNLDSRTC